MKEYLNLQIKGIHYVPAKVIVSRKTSRHCLIKSLYSQRYKGKESFKCPGSRIMLPTEKKKSEKVTLPDISDFA